jgi:hypothetical protein
MIGGTKYPRFLTVAFLPVGEASQTPMFVPLCSVRAHTRGTNIAEFSKKRRFLFNAVQLARFAN